MCAFRCPLWRSTASECEICWTPRVKVRCESESIPSWGRTSRTCPNSLWPPTRTSETSWTLGTRPGTCYPYRHPCYWLNAPQRDCDWLIYWSGRWQRRTWTRRAVDHTPSSLSSSLSAAEISWPASTLRRCVCVCVSVKSVLVHSGHVCQKDHDYYYSYFVDSNYCIFMIEKIQFTVASSFCIFNLT